MGHPYQPYEPNLKGYCGRRSENNIRVRGWDSGRGCCEMLCSGRTSWIHSGVTDAVIASMGSAEYQYYQKFLQTWWKDRTLDSVFLGIWGLFREGKGLLLLLLLPLLPQQQQLLLLLIILYVCYIAHAPTAVLTLMYTLSVLIKLSGSFKIQNKKHMKLGKGVWGRV